MIWPARDVIAGLIQFAELASDLNLDDASKECLLQKRFLMPIIEERLVKNECSEDMPENRTIKK